MNGQDLLEKLSAMLCDEVCSEVKLQCFVQDLNVLTSEIRQCWISEVFSKACNDELERYFHYQISFLSRLLTRENSCIIPSCIFGQKALQLKKIAACNLIDFATVYFFRHVNGSVCLNDTYKKHFAGGLAAETALIKTVLQKSAADKTLKDIFLGYINEFFRDTNTTVTLDQLRYFRNFVIELISITKMEEDAKRSEAVRHMLFNIDFNHFGVFLYLQETIRGSYAEKAKRERIIIMDKHLIFLQFKTKGDVMRYDQRWPSLSVMLFEWLKGEQFQMEQARLRSSVMSNRLFKLPFQLPVSHIAFLVRLLYKANVFGSVRLTEVFCFFTTHVSSKRQQHLSPGAFSKDYYTKNMVTAVEVRHLLSKMIAEINRDYFPVLAAICAVVFY
ncbi:MAG: hypothetical protein V4456_16785 [Bacteroidota bacterium]